MKKRKLIKSKLINDMQANISCKLVYNIKLNIVHIIIALNQNQDYNYYKQSALSQ